MKKRIFALLMALVMVFSLNTTYLAAPGDSPGVDNTVEVPDTVNVSINEDWMIEVDHVLSGLEYVSYQFNIYKDGEWLTNMGAEVYGEDGIRYFNMSEKLDGEGEYYVEVTATYKYSSETIKINGKTNTAKYVMPEKRLDTPKNIKYADGIVTFNKMEGVNTYRITYYVINKEYDYESSHYYDMYVSGDTGEINIKQSYAGIRNDADIYLTITALSNDAKNIYHSEESEKVGPYEHRLEQKTANIAWDSTKVGNLNVGKFSDGSYNVDATTYIYKNNMSVGYAHNYEKADVAYSLDFENTLRTWGAGEYTAKTTAYEWDAVNSKYIKYLGEATLKYSPATTIAAPTNVSITTDGVMTFDWVDGVKEYQLFSRAEYGSGSSYEWSYDIIEKEDGKDKASVAVRFYQDELDWAKYMVEEEGRDIVLKIGVRALTDDISAKATSEITWVTVYESKATAEEVVNRLDTLLKEDAPVAEVRDTLVNVSNDTLVELMKDTAFVEKIKTVEANYVKEMNINVLAPKSSVTAIDASKITVVGAALNAAANADVQLTVSTPATKVTVPEKYKAGVQLDINLLIDGEALEDLSVPVTLTMPIPAGVDAKNLVILHYHGDATEPVVITPTVNADGTMTFTVTGFSTFVVTNLDTDAVKSPSTADASVAVACGMMLVAAAAVVVLRKRTTK